MPPGTLTVRVTGTIVRNSSKLAPNTTRFSSFRPFTVRFPAVMTSATSQPQPVAQCLSSPAISQDCRPSFAQDFEENIEKVIYRCRFLAILAVWGSLIGSVLCFVKGSTYIVDSFRQYFMNGGKVIFLLLESIDVYLLGTVMLVFGMGLYELFISDLDIFKLQQKEILHYRSNLFGLFTLKERPKWLEIKSVNELKTKLGHVIVMLLLLGLVEKSKKAAIHTPTDLLCFAASVLLSSGCLYLLSKLNGSE